MTIKQWIIKKGLVAKRASFSLTMGALLLLAACSDDNTMAKDTAASGDGEVEAQVVEPVVDSNSTAAVPSINESSVPTEVIEAAADEPVALAANAGAMLYASNCKICHENGLLNAPKYGDKGAWTPRIAKGKETLYTHSSKGFNQMPAQANADISEAQVNAAVDYMLAAVS